MKRTFGTRPVQVVFAVAVAGIAAFACGDDDADVGPKPDAGASDGGDEGGTTQPTKFSRASRGSGMDISEDDTILVAVNRDTGSLSVFDVAGAALTKKAEVQLCAEPYQVVLTPNGDRAFVVCRKDQKLVRVDGLRGEPVKGPEVAVGSEPTGVALTPKATRAWVTNWMDGTAMEIDTEQLTVLSTVDLNAALVETGALGSVAPRPALAHPRSIAITNNKDDVENDESVFITEYFAQTKEALSNDGKNADVAKQGFVYRISLRDKSVRTIPLAPIANIGLQDHNGDAVGCYPNQVQAVDVQGSFAYVLSICASPRGPIADYAGPAKKESCAVTGSASDCPGGAAASCTANGCTTNCTTDAECGVNGGKCTNNVCETNQWDAKAFQSPAVHVIDIGGNKVIASVALNGEFDKHFAATGVPDTSARRFPLNIDDIAFVPGTLISYISAKGSDAVYRVEFNATYETKAIDALGSPDRPFIPLDVGTLDARKQGKLPIAIAMAHGAKLDAPQRYAFVLNEATRNITVLDLTKDEIAGMPDAPSVVETTPMPSNPAEEAILEGKRLFGTGLGRWSLNGQAWGACETCHWEGLSDQVTWFHLRGPRQSPSLDQSVNKKTGKHRFQNWSAVVDEFEDHEGGALRGILGGTGAIVKDLALTNSSRINVAANGHGGLNGSAAAAADPQSPSSAVKEVSVIDDWKKLSAYMRTIRSPRRPSNLDAAAVTAGRAIFEQGNCQGCHGGDNWTISEVFYTPTADPALGNALKTRPFSGVVGSFPAELLPTADPDMQRMRWANNANAAANDCMVCLLRPVGTYNVAEDGVGVAELRRDHSSPAQGNNPEGKGYNVPSLIGVAVNAPYFHAGNARTLEAVLSDKFKDHYASAVAPAGFLNDPDAATKRAQLVQFLLSIDVDTAPVAIPALGPAGGNFCSAP